jgi:flagellum-specific peptidoglycan hydrolase FlgJ
MLTHAIAAVLGAGGAVATKLLTTKTVRSSAADELAFWARLSPVVTRAIGPKAWPDAAGEVLVAWSAMESDYARSELARTANNLYGIKAGPAWKGAGKPFVTLTTREHQGTPREIVTRADFRSYPTWSDSVLNLLALIAATKEYQGASIALSRGDVDGFFQEIDHSGYSTAADYAQRIKNFMPGAV